MKSQLSHILPVSDACSILGEPVVRRMVRSFLSFRSKNPDPQEELQLIRALFYEEDEDDDQPVPPEIRRVWNVYTKRTMGLDKTSFLQWTVPPHVLPHVGPGGHLGLFDCWVYALSAAVNHFSATTNSSAAAPNTTPLLTPVVLLPDWLVSMAICQEYRQTTTSSNPKRKKERDYATMMLSVLAFRLYDSYQKKGIVTRDTLHRFLSDVHGEDSYKALDVRQVLDRMFQPPRTTDDQVEAKGKVVISTPSLPCLTASQFCQGLARTMTTTNQDHSSHVLLDWIATLATQLLPPESLPLSTQAYLETISSSLRDLSRLCTLYGLAEHSRLYDIKRRFHSLVESSNVIQGDPMLVEEPNANPSKSSPKHVISQSAFVKAVANSSEELGHGGYLPQSLAIRTFMAGCPDQEGKVLPFWALYDVLKFGMEMVRLSKPTTNKLPLLKFAFRVFSLPGEGNGRKVITRAQVGQMVLLLLEHATFRLRADSPRHDGDSDELGLNQDSLLDEEDFNIEGTMVDVAAASLLGILPSDTRGGTQVSLEKIVDDVLRGEEYLTFDAFCQWNETPGTDLPNSQQRLGPYLLELQVIASVLFGIPPTRASLESRLVEEVQRRHKYRYPQTEISRRGPRGTVWHILEDRWFRLWSATVQNVTGTDEDLLDGRDLPQQAPRSLGKINNTGLLADNGSLALRTDIRWRHDYEIIPPMAWSALQAWYDGGPPIYRTVVPYIPTAGAPSPHSRVPRVRTENEIELYPFFVTIFLCDAASRGEARPFQQSVAVSRVSPARVLLVQLCKGLDMDPKFGRLWMMASNPDGGSEEVPDRLLNLDVNIVEQRQQRRGGGETGNASSFIILLELKDKESGKWPRGLDGKHWEFRDKGRDGGIQPFSSTGDGIVGLYNMGNTCYLNSSIQCLSHTPIFRDYFTSKVYLNDINTTNPLGHQGHLAQVSAVLINSLWKNFNQATPHHPKRVTAPGSYAPVNAPALTPKTFKEALGKFNDHFAGNEQHDAQELLAFLLGGLSEDLNRIVDKPYIEAPDSDGRPDSELADIWWSNHLKREMSIIVALFTGQYKSLLTCRSCKYESARFEPFSFLQLPLPEDDQILVSLILYPLKDGKEPMKYSVRVRHDGKLLDVLISLAKVLYADEILAEHGDENGPPLALPDPTCDGDAENDANKELEVKYQAMAQGMAVVDMREGYIFKIAPNSWSLPDLQSKDTGELPLLHVYELEPLPKEMPHDGGNAKFDNACKVGPLGSSEATGTTADEDVSATASEEGSGEDEDSDEDSSSSDAKDAEPDNDPIGENDTKEAKVSAVKFSFLAIAQRRSEVVSRDVLHPFSHQVFGTPLLLRVVDLDGYSGRDLYDMVAKRMRNFVPKPALRFLMNPKDFPQDEEDRDMKETKVKERVGTRQRRHRTTSEMETVSAGPVPRYGFRIRLTSRDGRRCALCPWFECCIGCLVPDDDYPTIAMCGDSLVLDWHFAVDIATSGFGLRVTQPDLPVSQSPFRVKGLGAPVKNHRSCGDEAKKIGYAGGVTLEDCLDAFAKEERIPEAYCSSCKDFRVQTKRMSLWRLPPIVIIHLKRFQFTQHMRRKLRDLVVFPVEGLDLSRIVASDSSSSSPKPGSTENGGKVPPKGGDTDDDTTAADEDDSNGFSPLSPARDTGRSVMLYDLYGVVHHQGALSGGHYVASLKSEIDGQWRMFNDAQVFEIHSRDVVDASAYILFYIRQDVKEAKLQDFWDTVAREGQGLTEEDMEKLMKGRSDRCVIS